MKAASKYTKKEEWFFRIFVTCGEYPISNFSELRKNIFIPDYERDEKGNFKYNKDKNPILKKMPARSRIDASNLRRYFNEMIAAGCIKRNASGIYKKNPHKFTELLFPREKEEREINEYLRKNRREMKRKLKAILEVRKAFKLKIDEQVLSEVQRWLRG